MNNGKIRKDNTFSIGLKKFEAPILFQIKIISSTKGIINTNKYGSSLFSNLKYLKLIRLKRAYIKINIVHICLKKIRESEEIPSTIC